MSFYRSMLPLAVILVSGLPANICSGQADAPVDVGYILRGAGTQYSVSGESRAGGAYGFDMTVHLTGQWGFLGSANINQLEGGAQIAGTLGVVKLPEPRGCGFDAWSFSLLFDQFTDTRIDKFAGSLYLNQLRLQTGYSVSPNMELGAVFSAPTNQDDDIKFFLTQFPNSLPLPGTVAMPQGVQSYLAGRSGAFQWSTNIGYRDSPGTWIFGGTSRTLLSERVAGIIGVTYEENPSNWSSFVGMQVNVSQNLRKSRPYGQACDCQVVRAQSPEPTIRLASMVQEASEQESSVGDKGTPNLTNPLDPKKFPFLGNEPDPTGGQRQPEFQTAPSRQTQPGPTYNAKFFNSFVYQQIAIWPNDFYRALGKGSLNDGQDDVQRNFSGYRIFDNNGNVLRNDLNRVRK